MATSNVRQGITLSGVDEDRWEPNNEVNLITIWMNVCDNNAKRGLWVDHHTSN